MPSKSADLTVHRVRWHVNLDAEASARRAAMARSIASLGARELILQAGGSAAMVGERLGELLGEIAEAGVAVYLMNPSEGSDFARLGALGLRGVAVTLDEPEGDAAAASADQARAAAEAGLDVEVITRVTRTNACAFDTISEEILALAEEHAGAALRTWEARFVIPGAEHGPEHAPTARQCERVFEVLAEVAEQAPYAVRAVDAPHFRRYWARRRRGNPGRAPAPEAVLFVDEAGAVYPSESRALRLGHVDERPLDALWRESPDLARLRAAESLGGKCGLCEYRVLCGGSRARAEALLGDPWAEDPACAYVPDGA